MLPLNEASTVGLPPLTGRLKTVPSPYAPPSGSCRTACCRRLSVKPASGNAPLLPLNEASTVGLPPLTGTLKTVPSSYAPPYCVVPYRVLPLSVKPARDRSPLLPLNEASTVGLPPLTGTLKTVPSPLAPPSSVVPYRVLPLSVKPAQGLCRCCR